MVSRHARGMHFMCAHGLLPGARTLKLYSILQLPTSSLWHPPTHPAPVTCPSPLPQNKDLALPQHSDRAHKLLADNDTTVHMSYDVSGVMVGGAVLPAGRAVWHLESDGCVVGDQQGGAVRSCYSRCCLVAC
jgi:hypothetical protein